MTYKHHTLGFDDRWMMLIGIPLIGFLMPILFFKADLSDGLPAYLPEWGVSTVFTIGYWLSMRTVFILMRRRFPAYEQTSRRLFFTAVFGLVVFFVLGQVLDFFHERFKVHPERPGVTEFDYTVASLTIVLLISTIYESIFLYHRWKQSLLEAERLRRENVESQLEGLKNQVNPHFLFNSLNTLSYLIPEDPDRAVRFVQQLSKVYRYVLDIRDQRLIPLEEELNFLNAYIFLMKERFGENLQVEKQISADVRSRQIVPLSLQMLLENAIKHNIISQDHPLTIELWSEGESLTVRNNLQRKHQQMPSTRVGLENIRSRYAFFTDEAVYIGESDGHFTIRLPLLDVRPEPVPDL